MRSLRSLRFALVAVSLIASTAFASPADPKVGAEYKALTARQPVQSVGDKIEVIEFFMYHCPACNAVEPEFTKWIQLRKDTITVRRVHMPHSGPDDPEAHMFVTLEAMGLEEKMHAKIFQAAHVQKIRFNAEPTIFEWVANNGVDKAKFISMWNSFGVGTKMKRLIPTLESYNVDSTPTFIVDGHYLTNPSMVFDANKSAGQARLPQDTMVVLDALIAKARAEKGVLAKPAAAAVAASKPAVKPAAKTGAKPAAK